MKLVHSRLAALLTLQAIFIFIHYLLFQIEDPVTVIVSNMALIALNMLSLNKVMLIISIWFSFRSLPKDHIWVKNRHATRLPARPPYIDLSGGCNYMKCSKCGTNIAYSKVYREYIDISRYYGDLSYYMKPSGIKSCREIVMDDALS